jgi:hypothetical protein
MLPPVAEDTAAVVVHISAVVVAGIILVPDRQYPVRLRRQVREGQVRAAAVL